MIDNFINKIAKAKNPYLIAEIGINHNGDISLAKEMIVAAKENGANCVKFQSFIADKYISEYATKLLEQEISEGMKFRLLGVGVSGFGHLEMRQDSQQMRLEGF